jgi:hypothetical protein
MFGEDFANDLLNSVLETQGDIRCANCENFISGAIDDGKWFCKKMGVIDIPIDIRKCFERGDED